MTRIKQFEQGKSFRPRAAFAERLPVQALLVAEYTGPVDRQATTTLQTSEQIADATKRASYILTGDVPESAPLGQYRATRLEMRWKPGSPPEWEPRPMPLSALGDDLMIEIVPGLPEESPIPSQNQ